MKMHRLSLLVGGIMLLASTTGLAQSQLKVHSKEQLTTLNEQMCYYLEGHEPELSHHRLHSHFKPGKFACIEQPFESKGRYRIHLRVSFCDSEDQAKDKFYSRKNSNSAQGVFLPGLGDETWTNGGEAFVRKGTIVIFVTVIKTDDPPSLSQNETNASDTEQVKFPPELGLEEVEVYNEQLKKKETTLTFRSPRREYLKEIVRHVLKFFEQYEN